MVSCRAKGLHPEARLPAYQTAGAAGADLHAVEAVRLPPGKVVSVGTGIALEIPSGFEGQVRPRSGLAARSAVTVMNAPGTIDSDYRGEVRVLLFNAGAAPHDVAVGDRIAQLVIAPAPQVEFQWSEALDATDRGTGGFGHTGR